MAAYLELSVSLSVIITAPFNVSLLRVPHCIKLFTAVISSSQQPGGVDRITPILQLAWRLRELK